MGKALLAGLSAAEFAVRYPGRRLAARTDRTITDTRELTTHLAEVRNHGYAVDRQELEPHLCCVAAPVYDRDDAVVASVSLSGPASRLLADAAIEAMAVEVIKTARQVSTRLGAPERRLS
jgi:DNA-binding IclR family transcriptional regulator